MIQFEYRLLILLIIALVRSSEEVKSSIKIFWTLHFVLWSEILCSRSMQTAGGNNTVRIMLMPISFRQTLSSCRRFGSWGYCWLFITPGQCECIILMYTEAKPSIIYLPACPFQDHNSIWITIIHKWPESIYVKIWRTKLHFLRKGL